jgi:ketosteroid isomerase-like protein
MKLMLLHASLAALLLMVQTPAASSPESAFNTLLEADRAFAAAAAGKSPAEAIAAMFAEDVSVPAGAAFLQGRTKAVEALKANPDNLTGSITWAPIGGNIAADGTQGFTFGYMTATRADGSKVPFKYLAYWVKGAEGWRVAVYRRRPRSEGDVSTALMKPALPSGMVAPSADAARIEQHRNTLAAAEKAFSDLAQTVGLGAAFAKNGRADAINMGGPKSAGFIVGAAAIAQSVGEGAPTDRSELEWSADRVIVASSGDLGVSIGTIRMHQPKEGQPSAFPFFTIWRRDNPSQPWRYIAE